MYSGSSETGVSTSMTSVDLGRGDAGRGESCFDEGIGGGVGESKGD